MWNSCFLTRSSIARWRAASWRLSSCNSCSLVTRSSNSCRELRSFCLMRSLYLQYGCPDISAQTHTTEQPGASPRAAHCCRCQEYILNSLFDEGEPPLLSLICTRALATDTGLGSASFCRWARLGLRLLRFGLHTASRSTYIWDILSADKRRHCGRASANLGKIRKHGVSTKAPRAYCCGVVL